MATAKTKAKKQTTTIADRLKAGGYEAACKELNRQPLTADQFAFIPDGEALFSLHKITTVIEAINEGHQFDWNNNDEYKYYPWWDMETYNDAPAGSGFSLNAVGCGLTATDVGARLVTRTREHAKFVAELMFEDYRSWIKK